MYLHMIKFLLLVAVILVCGFAGYILNLYYKTRIDIYEDVLRMCNTFKSEIYFLQTDFKTLLSNFSAGKTTSAITQEYLKGERVSSVFLKPKESGDLTEFFSSIGKHDVDGEIKNLTYWEGVFKLKRDAVKDFYDKYGVMILKLSIIVGSMLAIILI